MIRRTEWWASGLSLPVFPAGGRLWQLVAAAVGMDMATAVPEPVLVGHRTVWNGEGPTPQGQVRVRVRVTPGIRQAHLLVETRGLSVRDHHAVLDTVLPALWAQHLSTSQLATEVLPDCAGPADTTEGHLPITGELLDLGRVMATWRETQAGLADAARAYAAAIETESDALIAYAAAVARDQASEIHQTRAVLAAALREREAAAQALGADRPVVVVRAGRAVLETARQVAGTPAQPGVTS